MILYPNAKINIGLNVIEKRVDGFHNLETLFYPVEAYDILEKEKISLVILDLMLGEASGMDVLREIKTKGDINDAVFFPSSGRVCPGDAGGAG